MTKKRRAVGLIGLGIGLIAMAAFLAGCGTFGTNPSAPSKVEQALFTTQTNYVTQTNVVEQVVPHYVTNQVVQTVTNQVAGLPPEIHHVTNETRVVSYETNHVTVTNTVPAYTETVSDRTRSGAQAVGSAVNMFVPGVGGLVTSGVLGLLSLWGYLRSSKLGDTSSALAQEVQTIRTFIQGLPNGQAYDGALVNFLRAHQGEANVTREVLNIIEREVDNKDAQVAAQEVMRTIEQLQLSTAGATVTATSKA